jgi:hypothetical protein
MAEDIQFPCPACGVTLRLPLAMASAQGPCPRCDQEIVAPDPNLGLSASLPTQAPPLTHETPPDSISESKPRTGRPPQRPPLLLAMLVTAVICLLAGYLIGTRVSAPLTSDNTPAGIPTAPQEENAVPSPEPTPAPEPPPPPGAIKASAAAENALKAFLDAPDWTTRAAHVLSPETTRPAMEAYSSEVPDGPTPWQSVSIQNSYTDKTTGNTLFIFQVITEQHPTGIPVAVVESDSGWQVDWQSFIEFRDNLFQSFAEGPADKNGRFHLLVSTPPPPRTANTENEHFSSFLLEPPFPGSQCLAYVRKTAGIHAVISAATSNGAVFTPVLEVAKRKAPDGKSYLEITGIVAHDWLPERR